MADLRTSQFPAAIPLVDADQVILQQVVGGQLKLTLGTVPQLRTALGLDSLLARVAALEAGGGGIVVNALTWDDGTAATWDDGTPITFVD